MLPIYVILAGLLLAPSLAGAQEQDAAPQEAIEQAEPAPEPAVRQAVPRGSRSQGDNPRRGTAVPRPTAPPPPRPPSPPATGGGRVPDRGRTVVIRPPSVYNYYYPPSYYSPRRYYPYGYSSFGLGSFYYDPYRWNPGYGYGSGYYSRPYSSFDIGELRLDVSPRYAQVYVDGYYAGVVDDFDGAFQALKLESGAYRIDIMMPGYETLTFDIRITPGQKIRYRGELRRRP